MSDNKKKSAVKKAAQSCLESILLLVIGLGIIFAFLGTIAVFSYNPLIGCALLLFELLIIQFGFVYFKEMDDDYIR